MRDSSIACKWLGQAYERLMRDLYPQKNPIEVVDATFWPEWRIKARIEQSVREFKELRDHEPGSMN